MENNFAEFISRIRYEDLHPEQLAMLRQEHAYLEKLKQHRIKIQDLTINHESMEKLLLEKNAQISKLEILLKERNAKIQELYAMLEEEKARQNNYEKVKERALLLEREKGHRQVEALREEAEHLKKQLREKDIYSSTLKTEMERKMKEMSEEHEWELKQITIQSENKYGSALQWETLEKEVEEYRRLVERQNRALKAQDQECEELMGLNCQLEEQIERFREEVQGLLEDKNKSEYQIVDLRAIVDELQDKLEKQKREYTLYVEMEQIRRQMGESVKEEISKIESLMMDRTVGEFSAKTR